MSNKYEKIEPKCKLSEVELPENLRAAIQEVVEDRDYAGYLVDEGLKPRKLILLHGPPGCGKTSIAHGIAAETSLPLYMVSGAQLISAYVGESSKHAEEVFKFAEKEECVMLIDEFDSFGGNRSTGYSYERRLVNTLLVNMETRPPAGLTVACTNFLDYIDPAILRRFDLILEVPQLSYEALVKVAENVLKGRYDISPAECVSEGITPSGTVRAATNKLRSAVIAKSRKEGRAKKVRSEKRLQPSHGPDYRRPQFRPLDLPSGGGWVDDTRQKDMDSLHDMYVKTVFRDIPSGITGYKP